MNKKTCLTPLTVALSALLVSSLPSRAVEGALGRPVSGTQITPYAGLVPPAPGFAVSVSEIYYDAEIGGSAIVPVARFEALNLTAKMSLTPITAMYIWNTGTNRWNFASAVTLPILWVETTADVTVGPLQTRKKESEFGLFDLMFTPIVASYHISPTDHLALSTTVWAPTGEYHADQLANLGLNNWTFVPGIAYTKILPKHNVELSASYSMEFYTENPDTDYQNGILSHLELLAVKRFKCGAGLGVVGSWIEQITDDESTLADRLDGFRGRAFGVGPVATYSTHVGKSHLDLHARWVFEFENENRLEGDAFLFSATLKF